MPNPLDRLPQSLLDKGAPPYVIAHRGNNTQAPENSMAAFRLALEQGAHALETDLHITQDRQIVCIHDPTLDRTTGTSGAVNARTLAALKTLRLEGSDEQIPALDAVFTAFDTFYLLELKAPGWKTAEDITLLADCLNRHKMVEHSVLVSFDHDILRALRQYAPQLHRGPIFMLNLFPPAGYDVVGVAWPMLYLNPLYVWLCHRRGQIFCPLDPSPELRLRYYLRLGVNFVLSDDPEKTLRALKELGR